MSHGERQRLLSICGKRALATLIAAVGVLGCGAATAAAQGPPAPGQLVEFEYRLSNVKSPGFPDITYTGGVVAGGGGSIKIQAGAVHAIVFANVNAAIFGWNLVSVGSAPLTATVEDWRFVNSGTVTGTATVPSGSSMTVTDVQTGHTTNLKNGAFSIPTGIGTLGARPPSAVNRLIRCHGGTRLCQARINFAGGTRHRTIAIRLTNTNLSLRSVEAASRAKHPVYKLTGGHVTLGGSEYVVTLDAARSIPPGSHLILTFRDHEAAGVRMATTLGPARCGTASRIEPDRLFATCGGWTMAAPTAATHALGYGAATAAVKTLPPAGVLAEFDYMVSDATADAAIYPNIFYTGGVVDSGGFGIGDQTLIIQSGAIRAADFLANAWDLVPAGGTPLTALLLDRRYVDRATVTGTAGVAAGSSMTVTNDAMHTITLKNGAFSIPAGVGGLGAGRPSAGHRLIQCHGGARSCQARINFAGGAQDRKIVIRLTNTNLSLRSVKALSSRKRPAYSLSGGQFVLGGSEYVVTLHAARSSPPGSHLLLTFRAKT